MASTIELERRMMAMQAEIANLKRRQAGSIESQRIGYNNPIANTQNAIATIVRWFNLTSVAADPMTGTMQRWDPDAGPAAWVDHNLTGKDVYAHPESEFGNYSEGLCPCVFVGGRWWAVTPFNDPAKAGAGVHNAFMKADATAGLTDDCWLDVDDPGSDTIEVNFPIAGGSDLNEALPRLADGDLVSVWDDGGTWRAIMTFQGSEDCTCGA
jgi:hypothetical protein